MSAELLQSGLVLVLVGVAVVYLGLRGFRSVARAVRGGGKRSGGGGCESGCGCSAGSEVSRKVSREAGRVKARL